MRKFALVALITIATVACGQTASAPSTTVFGLELGKPFNVPECSLFKLGRKGLPVPQVRIPGAQRMAYELMLPVVKPA